MFRKTAQEATKGATSPISQAYRLQKFLRTTAKYDITAPPGHSLKALEFFMDTTYRGTSEQFASAFALLARTLGLPARVVVGFRPGEQDNGVYHVRSGHVLAWAEIKFEKLGWRPFHPTPGRSGAKDDHDVVSAQIQESEQLEGEFGQGGGSKDKQPSAKKKPDRPVASSGMSWWWAIAVVPLGYAGVAAGLPWWRRRSRRRGGGPSDRVMGAWRQACDDLGLRGERTLTAAEVVAGHPGARELRPLADLANHVRYAPESVTTEAAEAAWRCGDAVRAHARRTTPLRARLLRRLDPRTFTSR
ncbi:transglutaminase family protein [Nonomuraea sp. NPDC059194]|uniref:transglutaminase-like domain-containing protein n=1 Tax=Nonomuraea sp. NPDC059194 TaxID=3346764 RepID=UPI0036A23805